MNKLFLIIQREFLTRVKKKSFIILTILMPFIMVALVFVPVMLASINDDEQKAVAIHDATASTSVISRTTPPIVSTPSSTPTTRPTIPTPLRWKPSSTSAPT